MTLQTHYRFSLRIFLFLFMAFVLLVSIPGTGYFMMKSAQEALIEEKQSKLFALAKLMDAGLVSDFNQILADQGKSDAGRPEKIKVLNQALKTYTDTIAAAQKGVGVGYYAADLDAIITYGPSAELGVKVGQSIAPDHPGRRVMATGQQMVQTAPLVRGEIMNCMYPIIRKDQVIGYIWANELVETINRQMARMTHRFYFVILLGVGISLAATSLVAKYITDKFMTIKKGLRTIQSDLDHRIEPISGEIGEISKAINEMAQALQERKRLEQQMERADRLAALGEIAAGVAHEVKNPITAVKGFLQLIEEDISQEDPKHEFIAIAIAEVSRLDKLAEQLLYYVRPSASQKIRADINQIIDNVLPLVDFRFEKEGITLEKNFAQNLPRVRVDEEQIKQVLLNLIINSTQAMEGKKIEDKKIKGQKTAGQNTENQAFISLATGLDPDTGRVLIRIRDTGRGIAPENLEKLFNPFFTTRSDGTGLGLAVSHRIMELHKGDITVTSQPDQGTCFTLSLPVEEDC